MEGKKMAEKKIQFEEFIEKHKRGEDISRCYWLTVHLPKSVIDGLQVKFDEDIWSTSKYKFTIEPLDEPLGSLR